MNKMDSFSQKIYHFLERPVIYNIVEKILTFGKGDKYMRECLLNLMRTDKKKSVLDVGCGTGRYADLFLGDYYGVDINPSYIDWAKKNKSGKYYTMDVTQKIDFPDNKFGYVLSVCIFHHIPDAGVGRALKEIVRVVRPGGRAYIIDAVFPPKYNLLGYLLFKFDRGRHQRTLENFCKITEERGFQLIQSDMKGGFPYRLSIFEYIKPV